MKLKSLIFAGLLTCFSCTNQSQGFYIEKFYPLATGCDGVANLQDSIAGNGYLDVAAGSPQFFIGVHLVGGDAVKQPSVKVGTTTTLEADNRDHPIVSQMVVTYKLSKRVGSAPKPYLVNISLPFSEKGEIFGPIQLISPELVNVYN